MATSDPFNVVGGLSVGIPAVQVIDANGNVIANNFTANSIAAGNATITGNITVGNIRTDNYYYANGVPLPIGAAASLAAPGNDTEIVFNIGGNASSSPNLRFDPVVSMLHVHGNICIEGTSIANFYYGDGSNLTNVSANTANTVTGNAQPNITSVGTLANLNVQGPANLGAASNLVITGGVAGQVLLNNGSNTLIWSNGGPRIANGVSNVSIDTSGGPVTVSSGGVANVITVNPSNVVVQGLELWVSGNVRANYFDGNGARLSSLNAANLIGAVLSAVTAGTVTTNAQPNITSVGTLTGITVNGISNLGANSNVRILGGTPGQVLTTDGTGSLSWISVALANSISDGNSILRVYANSNITANVNGVANVLVINEVDTVLKANFIPDSNNSFNLGSLTNQWKDLYLSGTTIYLDGVPLTMNSGTRELSVDGNVVLVYDSTDNGNLNVPTNIVTVGNVTGGNLTTPGNLSVTGNANVGNIGAEFGVFTSNVSANNLAITSNATVTGNLTAGNIMGIFANGTSNVRIPAINGNVVISAAGNANILTITGVGANVAGNLTASNLVATGQVVATGNVIGGNIITSGTLTATELNILGNVTGANVNSLGNIEAPGYIQGGNIFANLGTMRAAVGNFNTIIGSLITGNQPNIVAVGNLGSLNVVGTATTGNTYANSGTIGANTVRANTLVINGNVQGHFLPSANITYDLGSPTQRWKDIYLSNNTIFLGAATIRSSGSNTITVPILEVLEGFQGNLVPVANAVFNIGSPNAQWNFVGAGTVQIGNTVLAESPSGDLLLGNNTVVTSTPNGSIGGNSFTALTYVETDTLFANNANIVDLNATGSLDVTGNVIANGHLQVQQDSSFGGNVSIAGNLIISGNISYIDVVDLRVQDPVIQQGGGPNGAPLTSNDGRDRGQLLHVFDTALNVEVDKFQGWDNSAGEFAFGSNVILINDVVTFNQYGNIRAGFFKGDGSELSDITGANVTGTVANASYSTVAQTAYSVSGSNISGVVANANYSAYSGVANSANSVSGGNVVGAVANATYSDYSGVADTSNSVAGANVTGVVANANYSAYSDVANTANSVSVANVVGIGNIATINLSGNSQTVLLGDGTWGTAGSGSNIGNLDVNGTSITISSGATETAIVIGNSYANITIDNNPNTPKFDLKVPSYDTQSYSDAWGDWTGPAEWITYNGTEGQIIFNNLGPSFQSFMDSRINQYNSYTLTINGVGPINAIGYGYGGGTLTLYTATAPDTDPTTVSELQFNLTFFNRLVMDPDEGDFGLYVADYNLELESQRDVRIVANDDFSVTANDGFWLRTNNSSSGIELITNYNSDSKTWLFGTDGNMYVPGNILVQPFASSPAPYLSGFSSLSALDQIEVGSNAVVINSSGNVLLTGTVVFDNLSTVDAGGNNISVTANTGGAVEIKSDGGNYIWGYDNYGYTILPAANPTYTPVANSAVIFAGDALTIKAGYANLIFDNTGNLSVAGNIIVGNGNSIIQSIANSSLDPINPNVSTLTLTPDQNYSSQSLVLDPTAPGHIHLRAPGIGGNAEHPTANIFLGAETTSFEITAQYANSAEARIHSGGNTWTFSNDGNLTLPGNIFAVNYANGTQVQLGTTNDYSNSNVANYLPTYAGNISAEYIVASYDVTANVVTANYVYGDGSNLTNVNANTANVAYSVDLANVVGAGNIASINLDGNSSTVLYGNGSWAPAGNPTTIVNGNSSVTIPSADGNIVVTSGSDTWTFTTTGNIVFPDGTTQGTAFPGVISGSPYRGFNAGLNRFWGDDPSVNQIIITNANSPTYVNLSSDTNDDAFQASGLSSGNIVVMLNVYGSNSSQAIDPTILDTLARAFIDNVLYDGSTPVTDAATARLRFYNTWAATFGPLVIANELYDNFQFLSPVTYSGAIATGGSGTGFVPTVLNDGYRYQVYGVSNAGSGYTVGDILTVTGDQWGGSTPDNDATFTVTAIDGGGGVSQYTVVGTPRSGTWPSDFISDGGSDQYDDGNYIQTSANPGSNIPYNDGNVDTSGSYWGGSSEYVTVYRYSTWAMMAFNTVVTSCRYAGGMGADGSGDKQVQSLIGGAGGIAIGEFLFNNNTMTLTSANSMYVKGPDSLYLDALADDVQIRSTTDTVIKSGVTNFATGLANSTWTFSADGNLRIPTNELSFQYSNGATIFGNISAVNLDGNVSNILRGDGTWGPDSTSTYGNSDVANFLADFGSNSISTTGNVTATRITLNSTGTAVDASQGNILTNKVTGTRFDFLSGLYTIGLTTALTSANYTITLPSNAGLAGQVLSGDGNGALSWTDSIANANYASFANIANTANLVVGGNVVGEVANANFATYSTTANSALSVSGANVVGQVANANYASYSGVAYSVDAANVVGQVANANYALFANVAYNVGGANVSGEVANANFATYTDTVVGSSQPNITSLGNLTSLQVNGSVTAVDGLFTGNLTVNGTTTYSNVNQLVVSDPIIDLGNGPNGAPLTANDGKDRGLYLHTWSNAANAEVNKFMGWHVANGEFAFSSNADISNNVVTINELGNVRAQYFIGDGSQLSNLSIGNATVGSANYANFAGTAESANSVAGANVTGEVANANYAQFAGTAYSVSGANISGEVANANYAQFAGTADSANSVAGANISGEVANANFATYSLYSNTANTANVAISLNANIANVTITGGSNGYVLSTDGSGNLNWVTNDSGEPVANALIASTQYPMGFDEATKLTGTTISFDNATRTFTIAPVGATFDVWVKGTKYTKTAETVVTGAATGAWYIYYTDSGVLTASNTAWNIGEVATVSYIYWNSTLGSAQMFFDERHGTNMDAATHEYLHRTRGASISTVPSLGFVISANTSGTGSSDSDAEIGISSGTFFDEDIQVDIVSSPTPTPNTWEQNLTLPGQIPVLYRSGSAWVLDTPTNFPIKFGSVRPTYNLNTGGTWSTPDVSNNGYFVQWIVATNNLNYPVMSIMGQDEYSTLSTAQQAAFSDLNLQSLPIAELRVLYGLVLQTANGYTNSVKARLRSYSDVRIQVTSVASLTTNAVDVTFRESPQTVFDNDATANAAWANYVGNYSGNINYTGANVTLGSISNLHITGGSNGQLLSTNGSGGLSFVQPFSLSVGQLSASNGNAFINTYSNITTLGFDEDSGFAVDDLGNGVAKISINSTFKYWEVNGNPGLIAEGLDTVNFIAGSGVTIEANNDSLPKTFTISASGAGGGNIGGSNTQVQYNDGGNFAGATDFTYDKDTGLVSISNTTSGATGIVLGEPSLGSLISNALSLTNGTSVSNSIALINQVLGKLVPPSPPNFPASQSISIGSLSTYRMANFVQTDNTPGANKSVAGGTTVTSVRRSASYNANSIVNAGPGDSGTITVYLNGSNAGSRTLTTALNGNGTYSNLVIYNNYDYNVANSSIAAGFWSVFSARAAGSVNSGWNEVYIADSATSNTNTPSWYYDASNPGTPQFSSVTITPPVSPSYTYTSTVPHYDSTNQFTLGFSVNRLSGDTYPTSDTFVTGTAGGAFGAPSSRTYAQASVTTPLERNLYVSSGNASVTTTAAVVSGFGSSSGSPSVSVTNSYNTGTQSFSPAATVLYKTGTASAMEEANITIGSTIGSGSGLAFRIINPGSTDTPVYSANAVAFNSQSSTLEISDATIVAAVLKHDITNYSTGYLPVGPDLSTGRSGAQYFTFKFIRSSVSKFDIRWTGTIAGLWVALPGSTIDSTSGLNGWINMATAYAGAGVPGSNTAAGGNGSDGAALGGVAPLNSAQVNKSVTATFGTVSSSSTATNEIYVRIKLTSGQSVTALSLQTASN